MAKHLDLPIAITMCSIFFHWKHLQILMKRLSRGNSKMPSKQQIWTCLKRKIIIDLVKSWYIFNLHHQKEQSPIMRPNVFFPSQQLRYLKCPILFKMYCLLFFRKKNNNTNKTNELSPDCLNVKGVSSSCMWKKKLSFIVCCWKLFAV